MKKAFITTVFNEEKTIGKLLNSLTVQKELPDEIIIVDAFSRDGTISRIKDFQAKFPKLKIKIYKKKGNRSVGRNFAVRKTDCKIIAASDAGCTLHDNWFSEITKPFAEDSIDVVAGFYKSVTRNAFEKCLAAYTCVPSGRVNEDFLPSSRSVAFKKNAWKKAGGYPEELDTCEDLVFARRMKKVGLNFAVNKKAIVYWPQRKSLWQAYKQFFSYAKGDGEALYIRPQTPLLLVRVIIAVAIAARVLYFREAVFIEILAILGFFYIAWSILKNYRPVGNFRSILYLPLLQAVSDCAVFLGMTVGFINRYLKSLK